MTVGLAVADRFRGPPSLRGGRIGCQNRGMLVGRDEERCAVESALERARSGQSVTLALLGEPGIGKTALLDYAAERADGMQLLRARGVESEARIPFASLLELLRPALGMLETIPEPQAVALGGALALRPAQAQERFAVGAARTGWTARARRRSCSPSAVCWPIRSRS
jgi:hypothetical protein